MADPTIAGIRIQDWIGIAMVAFGTGVLIWFSWDAETMTKAGVILAISVAIVVFGYVGMRRQQS